MTHLPTATTNDGWRINLIGCTDAIRQELTLPKVSRRGLAVTYAMAMKSENQGADKPDWKAINGAIIDKWGVKGLNTVKTRAWRILEGRERL